MCGTLEVGLREKFFPMARKSFSKILISMKGIEIEDNIEKICRRYRGTASHEIDLRAHGLPRDHPTAWKIIFFFASIFGQTVLP